MDDDIWLDGPNDFFSHRRIRQVTDHLIFYVRRPLYKSNYAVLPCAQS
jgi:hypothetical protein